MTKYNSGKWTQARFNSFIKSALRSASQRWPPKFEAMNEACIGAQKNKKTGRLAKHYKCNNCKKAFPATDIQLDHINPVVDPDKGFVTWDELIIRMFCERDGYQVLCKPCHQEKSAKEKTLRKSVADAKKKNL